MLVNGYAISGNLATVGRRYTVTDSDGNVVHEAPGKVAAMQWAENAEPCGHVELEAAAEPVVDDSAASQE